MEVTFTQEFDFSLAEVLQAREKRYEYIGRIEGLKPPNFLKRRETKTTIYTEREFQAADRGIPPALKRWLTEDLFTMKEKATFYKKSHRHSFEVEPRQFREQFSWKGSIQYGEKEGRAYRKVSATISVKIPFLGKNLEETIARAFAKSMEKDFKTICQAALLLQKEK